MNAGDVSLADAPLPEMMAAAAAMRDAGFGDRVTYSRKVFIPLTKLCRDVCHYCTFANAPRRGERAYLTAEEVLAIARVGARAGCTEALFTLGDKPELRYRIAREELEALGHGTTISYLAAMARLVIEETGLLPHLNPGVMARSDFELLRPVSVSMGLMLESTAPGLALPGGPHHGSPDKDPHARLEAIRLAGEARVPMTTGILIGIGESRAERVASLGEIRALHDRYDHIQEIIIQNFRAKAATRMAHAPEPDLDELLWTIAAARLLFGPDMPIQAPPNLSGDDFPALLDAGINDWGGVSPVTPDHVNPEAPWPPLERLAHGTESRNKVLVARLPVYPRYMSADGWLDPAVRAPVLRAMDAEGFAREDDWHPGSPVVAPRLSPMTSGDMHVVSRSIERAVQGQRLSEAEAAALLQARGSALAAVISAADALRREVAGDTVSYVVNRNINYTNVCSYRCGFCAFSKGRLSASLRGTPYDLALEEVARRAREAWERGATEVCLQGGIHPDYTGGTYLEILGAVRSAAPEIHVHAFSPLEVSQGAATLGISVAEFLTRLREAGLGSLPGTAAEILDDRVRRTLCPDKLSTGEWLSVVETAHGLGLRTTATIMFGHLETPADQARHLLRVRDLQERSGGLTELVPLPFVHFEAPIYLRGLARKGPTFRETVLVHSVARLVLNPLIANIQASWVKLGHDGAGACLDAGVNDLGGTLMNESISRAAGAVHGQELSPESMEALIRKRGRVPRQRSTLYGEVRDERREVGRRAAELAPLHQTQATKYAHGEAVA